MNNICNEIQKQANLFPQKIAIKCNGISLTYRELILASSLLRSYLTENGISKGDKVALYMPNSIEAVIAMVAVISAGAVVLPISTQMPADGMMKILKDSGAKTLLHLDEIQLPYGKLKICPLEDYLSRLYDRDSAVLPIEDNYEAFCIYTSGSTGQQKGMLLNHEGILNHIWAKINILGLNQVSVICQSFNIGFVATIWQIFAPFILGTELVIYSNKEIRSPLPLFKKLAADKVSVVSLLPRFLSTYCNLIDQGHEKILLPSLKAIVLTGEEVSISDVKLFYAHYKIPLINAYGQSECSDDTLHYRIPFDFDEEVPIGAPIQNVNAFLINDDGTIMHENNAIGELCLSGICLAKPIGANAAFTSMQGFGQVFKSGDLVKRNKDGLYVYCGRKDNLIKISGHRIYIEEIERELEQYPGIHKAIVSTYVKNDGLVSMAAYYQSSYEMEAAEIKKHLQKRLPNYFIPSNYQRVEHFSYLPNGKINRRMISHE